MAARRQRAGQNFGLAHIASGAAGGHMEAGALRRHGLHLGLFHVVSGLRCPLTATHG